MNIILAINILFTWAHSGELVDGYNLYKGTTPTKMVKVATVEGGQNKSLVYDMQDTTPQIFGISAYNKVGESSITTTDSGGALVKLGKPESPNGYTWSVK